MQDSNTSSSVSQQVKNTLNTPSDNLSGSVPPAARREGRSLLTRRPL